MYAVAWRLIKMLNILQSSWVLIRAIVFLHQMELDAYAYFSFSYEYFWA